MLGKSKRLISFLIKPDKTNTMHLDNIFESGHLVSTIVGWIIFIVALAWVSNILPYAYDAWLINRKIDLTTFDSKKSEKRQAAIKRLTDYQNIIVNYTSWRNPSRILNDFGRHTMIMSALLLIIMVIGILFPAIVKALYWLITVTM